MIIYKVTNLVNGKVYIGQTQQKLNKRKIIHKYEAKAKRTNNYFHNALSNYGIGNFNWEVICICPNIDSLNEREAYYIVFYGSMNKKCGYNILSGGNGIQGYKHSKETIEKIRKSSLGIYPSLSTRAIMSKAQSGTNNAMYGEKHSTEAKVKMSKSNPKYWLGKHLTEETKGKISETKRKGKYSNCNYCGKKIWRKPSEIRNGTRMHCSKACYHGLRRVKNQQKLF